MALGEGLWLTLGSDHTDRKVEAYSINVSKQMCPHPIGKHLWHFADVAPPGIALSSAHGRFATASASSIRRDLWP